MSRLLCQDEEIVVVGLGRSKETDYEERDISNRKGKSGKKAPPHDARSLAVSA